jgi:hypothetical protein
VSVHLFGIRHHGPGSARSLRRALEALAPDLVLVEGPPEADALVPLAAHPEMKPPVALLVYDPAAPARAVYYPFAEFSPEWQALRFALERGVPARFFDLPQAHQLGAAGEDGAGPGAPGEEPGGEGAAPEPELREDPLGWLARAAGEADGERWWERLVETRADDADLFAAVLEAMTALRGELALPETPLTLRREAYMRQQLRAAEGEGFGRIAVVCGAWHAPALAERPTAKADRELLKGLPKAKLAATWVPWTYGRLATASGYGAGVDSPGWYHHLWEARGADPTGVTIGWLARVARMLRDEGLEASAAQAVDATRLAESLATLRGLSLPGLGELNEAATAVFWGGGAGEGAPLPLRLIHERLVVGERLGEVPAETPSVPLQQDLAREQKRLRLPPEAMERPLELDLRKELDLERSRLLHRLHLLGVPWGAGERVEGGKRGTFHERWRLRWRPEFAVALIEAGVWGNTVAEAAGARVVSQAERVEELPALTGMLGRVLLAELPGAARHLIARIDARAAEASDVRHLMDALPPVAETVRYGDVRGTDAALLRHVADGLVARVSIGLSSACASLSDDAAAEMVGPIAATDAAVSLLQDEHHQELWKGALAGVAGQRGVHGLVAGRVVRLLLDGGALTREEASRRLGLELSAGADPAGAAAWLEGFLAGGGLVLLHDAALRGLLDEWLAGLAPGVFTRLLPLLRRTFSTFAAGERRALGDLARGAGGRAAPRQVEEELDAARAEAVLPLLAALLGIGMPAEVRG